MSISAEMSKALKEEAKKRKLGTAQETMRAILSDYFMLRESEKEGPSMRSIKLEDRNPLAH
jgi:hypothetical protein